MHYVDTHTHLYAKEFEEDIDKVIENARALGVETFLLPNVDSNSIAPMRRLCIKYPHQCVPMMGLHPCSVNENYEKELQVVKHWLSNKFDGASNFCAVGEIGIDLHWDKSFLKQQQIAFRKQIEWAKERSMPVVIHMRESFEETFEIVSELNDENLKGVFHCFSGTAEQAKKILSLGGFKLGIGGVVTFKNGGLDKILSELSLEDIVLETDSPYLAPEPYRGKRNESAYLVDIAKKIAEIKSVSVEVVGEVTSATAMQMFLYGK